MIEILAKDSPTLASVPGRLPWVRVYTGVAGVAAVVVGGVLTLGVVASVGWFVPALRRLGRLHPDEKSGV